MGQPSKYRGVPKKLWAQVRQGSAQTNPGESPPMSAAPEVAVPPNVFAPQSAVPLPQPTVETPRINSEPALENHIPRNLFNGTLKTLDVMGKNGSFTDPIPGYRLYWFNDPGGTGIRISQAQLSGWSFVGNDEVLLTENMVGNNDLGSQVTKIVDPGVNPPTRAYLMKLPRHIQDAHDAEREQIHQQQEAMLRAGTLGRKPGDKQYSPAEMAGRTNLPPIEIKSNLSR